MEQQNNDIQKKVELDGVYSDLHKALRGLHRYEQLCGPGVDIFIDGVEPVRIAVYECYHAVEAEFLKLHRKGLENGKE